jgi:hypothetical protein
VDPPLVAIRRADASELELRKPSWHRAVYELRAGDALVGVLARSGLSSRAEARAADGYWRFGRSRGFRRRYLPVLAMPFDQEVARFDRRRGKGGGTLAVGGREYTLEPQGRWKPTWRWEADGVQLASLAPTSSLGDLKARVALTPAGSESADASLLVLLGAHVVLLTREEDTAAGGGGGAGG